MLVDLAVGGAVTKREFLDRRRIRVWFGTNFEGGSCHRDDPTGCQLYEATVLLPLVNGAGLKVVDGPHEVDGGDSDTGAWFPSVTRKANGSGDILLAWNRIQVDDQKNAEQKNDMPFQVVRADGSVTDKGTVTGAKFPHWHRSGGGNIAYTLYSGPVGTVVYGSGVIGQESEDGSFVGTNSSCVVYQQDRPQGDPWKGPLASCRPDSAGYSPSCGHASSPLRGGQIICSEARVGLKSVRLAAIGDSSAQLHTFMGLQDEYAFMGLPDCYERFEAYTSWGDRSDLFVVTVLCVDMEDNIVGSRVYLVRHGPYGEVTRGDVLDLSSALEVALGRQPLQFCTADFISG